MHTEAISPNVVDDKMEEVQRITLRKDALEDEKKILSNLARELARKVQSQLTMTNKIKKKKQMSSREH